MAKIRDFADRLRWWSACVVLASFLVLGVLGVADLLLPGSPFGFEAWAREAGYLPQ
jgi:hypothetical protein